MKEVESALSYAEFGSALSVEGQPQSNGSRIGVLDPGKAWFEPGRGDHNGNVPVIGYVIFALFF